jgi:hypothetical protein
MTSDLLGGVLAPARGRHRRPDPVRVVHLVLQDGEELTLAADAGITRSIGQVAALLAHW